MRTHPQTIRHDTVEAWFDLVDESERAIFVSDGENRMWLPKSVITIDFEKDDTIRVEMPYWLAKKKGVV